MFPPIAVPKKPSGTRMEVPALNRATGEAERGLGGVEDGKRHYARPRPHVSLAKAFQKFRDCDSDFKKYKRTKNGRSLGWGSMSATVLYFTKMYGGLEVLAKFLDSMIKKIYGTVIGWINLITWKFEPEGWARKKTRAL